MNLTKNSIEAGELHDLAGAFFDNVLMPMAASMQASGIEVFTLKPDASRDTYYMRRAKRSMTHDDFIAPSCNSIEDLELCLAAHWKSLGRRNFANEISRIAAVARTAHAPSEQDAEVSPFVYTMF